MKNEIQVKWEVSTLEGTAHFTPEELGCKTVEEFNALPADVQNERAQDALDKHPEQPYMVLHYIKREQ